jgi:hypothetical protein
MTKYQCTPGCGLGQLGEVAAAPFLERKWTFFVGGGSLRTVASAENASIKCRTSGFGLKLPGDGVAAMFEMQKKMQKYENNFIVASDGR